MDDYLVVVDLDEPSFASDIQLMVSDSSKRKSDHFAAADLDEASFVSDIHLICSDFYLILSDVHLVLSDSSKRKPFPFLFCDITLPPVCESWGIYSFC